MKTRLLLARAWVQYAVAEWLRRSAIRLVERSQRQVALSKARMRLADRADAFGDHLYRVANKIEQSANQKQVAIIRADRGRS